MMNGMNPSMGDMGGQAPSPVQEGGTSQNPKSQVEAQLMQLLNEAARVAADNGVDFKDMLVKFMRGSAGGPPTPPAGGPQAGGAPTKVPTPPNPAQSPLG